MNGVSKILFYLATLCWAAGITTARATEPPSLPEPTAMASDVEPTGEADTAQTGIASWYGRHFNRKRTASGEAFDAKALTAAHPSLPLHSLVRVTLLSSGRSVVVRINDRGPHTRNRLIDISHAAAAKIGLLRHGAGMVRVEPVTQLPASK